MSGKPFDFKKEMKGEYGAKDKPELLDVGSARFLMVDGEGDPNGNADFQTAVEALYALSYAIKMSRMKGDQPEGYFDFVVPPLEGLWWVEDDSFSLVERTNWKWTLMIRQPDFVTGDVLDWAASSTSRKKPELDLSKVRLEEFEEGMCAQILHKGPYSTEPETIARLHAFIGEKGLATRLGSGGKHHEIYLSDPRKAKPESMKTILRQPVEKA